MEAYFAPTTTYAAAILKWLLNVDFVEELRFYGLAAIGVMGGFRRGQSWASAPGGEDRLRKGDELRQLPEILGGGG